MELRSHLLFDEIIEIADDDQNDYIEQTLPSGDIIEKVNSEHIQRSRLRVDARKWVLSKMNPKKYGEKLDLDMNSKQVIEYVNVSKQFPNK